MKIPFLGAHASNYAVGRGSTKGPTEPGAHAGVAVRYIVLHYTGNDGDTAENNAKYFARTPNLKASAHFFVDENSVWQSVREADTAYHCGAKTYRHAQCRNANSIGVELCSRKDAAGAFYFLDATISRAVELVRELCAKYDVPKARVLRHYDVTGKRCPASWVKDEGAWVAFLERVFDEKAGDVVVSGESTVEAGSAVSDDVGASGKSSACAEDADSNRAVGQGGGADTGSEAGPGAGNSADAGGRYAWAEVHLESLLRKGAIGDASQWRDFGASAGTLTVGQLLALVDKASGEG